MKEGAQDAEEEEMNVWVDISFKDVDEYQIPDLTSLFTHCVFPT